MWSKTEAEKRLCLYKKNCVLKYDCKISSSRVHSWSDTFLTIHYDLPDNIVCDIAIYADDTTHYSKCDQASDLWQQLELASELESDLWDTIGWAKKWFVGFNFEKTQLVCLTGLITVVLLMWKWMGLFFRKNHLLRCWDWPSLLNWIWVLTLSLLLKLPPRKLEL